MLTLKNVLGIPEIQSKLQENLCIPNSDYPLVLRNLQVPASNYNSIKVNTIIKGKQYTIEANLHVDKKKNLYLLEARVFRKNLMETAYLEVLNPAGFIYPNRIDDVWAFADWKAL